MCAVANALLYNANDAVYFIDAGFVAFACVGACSRLHLWGVMRIHVLGWSVDGSGACTAPPNYSRVLVLVALRLLVLFRQIKRLSNPRARLFVVDCHCLYDDNDSQLEDVFG